MERLPEMLALRETRGLAWLRAIPLVLIVIMVPVEIFTSTVELWAVIAAMPPLAALVNGPKITTVVSAASVVACVTLETMDLGANIEDGHSELLTVVLIGATSVLIAYLRDRVVARLLSIESVAEAAQRALLPELPKRIGRIECAARYRAATADSSLGGDFFDLLDTPWGIRAVLGDVSGHGLDAVMTTAAILGSFREGALDDVDLNALSVRLERRMTMCNQYRGDWTEEFATTLLMAFDRDGSTVEIRSFGHHVPLLVRGSEVLPVALDPAPPLGLVGEHHVEATSVGRALAPGDLLVAFTDGLLEARDRTDRLYPLEDRLRERVAAGPPFTHPSEAVEFLFADVKAQGHRLTDDAAALVLRIRGPEDGPAVRRAS
ncbi:PP2C family protein-serine/threonine phosphatase [Glycomyces paridis]|uniref:Serine/threonine-protein phosphatase n=1 Tax=Glycomyces paridis TaxID=2126555 RepID=A0A4S8PHM6_9ACTN|nr:PP2C family protein-serine/threonine phosphatase [Glycomyces paridis]THV29461.1 serine/threonine-protein phosphatase [Glycomyces paridis]